MLNRGNPLTIKIRGGFSMLDMKRFVDSLGFEGIGYQRVRFDQLTQLGPAIVPVTLFTGNHFVVFRGSLGDKVLIADPAFGNVTVEKGAFERSWVDNIAFVVTSKAGSEHNRLGRVPQDHVVVPPNAIRRAVQR